MALVVTGQVRHRQLQPDQVMQALQTRLPNIVAASEDFQVQRPLSTIKFFCNNTCMLDFTVTIAATNLPAPATVAVLVRETDALNAVLVPALSKSFRRAEVEFCVMEDQRSRKELLSWKREPPLTSRPARLSYLICFLLLTLGTLLIYKQFEQPPSDARTYNVVSLALAVGIPVIAIPLPFLFEHMKVKETGRWSVARMGGETT